ncbi:MAG: hypothetical protein GWP91_03290 [Rhodobacterales bacterium]|nr:hypothetical protein [Rhodobacterales bacterium]
MYLSVVFKDACMTRVGAKLRRLVAIEQPRDPRAPSLLHPVVSKVIVCADFRGEQDGEIPTVLLTFRLFRGQEAAEHHPANKKSSGRFGLAFGA